MCALEGRSLRRSTLLIVDATGDVGCRLRPLRGSFGETRALSVKFYVLREKTSAIFVK
jgi:hypothetical protein